MNLWQTGRLIAVIVAGLIVAPSLAAVAAAPATPEPASPEALFHRLLTTPFTTAGTVGLGQDERSGVVLAIWNDTIPDLFDGSVGAVHVIFPRLPMATLNYWIYPDERVAAAVMRRVWAEQTPSDRSTGTPVGFGEYPAALLTSGDDRLIVVQVGTVLVTARTEDPQLALAPLAATLVDHLVNVSTGKQSGQIPVSDPRLAGVDPWILHQRLLTEPFAAGELPAGFTMSRIVPWDDFNDRDLRGAIGAVQVTSVGSELTGIAYIIYPNQDAADFFFQRFPQFDSCEHFGEPPATPALDAPDGGDDYTVCVVKVGYVLLIGASEGDTLPQARALARAGEQHVLRLVREMNVGTPRVRGVPMPSH